MPHRRREAPAGPTPEELELFTKRIVTGPEPERFYCPHPGCNRSFAELWRLKVHYRAPPDVRGSGKERGHGTELSFCPKCGKDLHPGKHHVGCVAGKSAPRQAAKRQRQMSTTTETENGTFASGTNSASIEEALLRSKAARASEAESPVCRTEACRLEVWQKSWAQGELAFSAEAGRAFVGGAPGQLPSLPTSTAAGPPGAQQQQHEQLQGWARQLPGAGNSKVALGRPEPAQLDPTFRPVSPGICVSDLFLPHAELPSASDLFRGPSPGAPELHAESAPRPLSPLGQLLRPPSPPPLPPEWQGTTGGALLFDFDQFDVNKRQQQEFGVSAPLVTVTTSMQPQELHNPSDDYIWQILFAAEDDLVPKRVTAHLHHPPELDDPFLWSHDPPQLQGWQAAPPGLMQPPPPRQPVAHEPLPNGATLLDDVLSKLEPTPLVDLLAWDAARAAAQALPPPRIPPAEQAMAWAAGAAPTPASQDDLPAAAAAGRSAGEGQLEGSAAVAARLPLKLAVEGVPNGVCPGAVALKVEGGAPAAAPPLMANHSPQPAQV